MGTARARAAGGALLAALAASLPGCAAEERAPNLLLVTIDTLRADRVGSYGYEHPTTPALDRLAAEGALFETAYAPMGTTCPSHATLFTSRHPLLHGVLRNGLPLLPGERTLAEVLKERGYATAAFVSSFPVSHRFGFAQGFDHFDDDFRGGETLQLEEWAGLEVDGRFDRRGERTADAALAWLEDRPAAPFFIWLHLFDPHAPYAAPQPFQELFPPEEREPPHRVLRARYDAEVRYSDAQLERVTQAFDAASAGRPSLVVVTSDHGEGLEDHGWPNHNRSVYEEEVRVPLILRWKGRIPAGRRIPGPAHLIDLAPTLLGLLGAQAEAAFDGEDLSDALTGSGRLDPERPLWLQRPFYPEGRPGIEDRGWGFGVRLGEWKLIEAPEEERLELYDLARDPGERNDLAAARSETAEALAARITQWRREQAARAVARDDDVPPELREGLRALGYVE